MSKKIWRDRWIMTPETDKFASSVNTTDSVKKMIDWYKEVKTSVQPDFKKKAN